MAFIGQVATREKQLKNPSTGQHMRLSSFDKDAENSAGMTLIEIMLALAIFFIMVIGVLRLLDNSTKTANSAVTKVAITSQQSVMQSKIKTLLAAKVVAENVDDTFTYDDCMESSSSTVCQSLSFDSEKPNGDIVSIRIQNECVASPGSDHQDFKNHLNALRNKCFVSECEENMLPVISIYEDDNIVRQMPTSFFHKSSSLASFICFYEVPGLGLESVLYSAYIGLNNGLQYVEMDHFDSFTTVMGEGVYRLK